MPDSSRVKVTAWCSNPEDSDECLKKIESNAAKRAKATKMKPWTSDCLIKQLAEDFLSCLTGNGGAGMLVDC
jgi:hypothetical protein